MRILIVLTSHDRLGDTGKKTGFWLEELAAHNYVLKDAGAAISHRDNEFQNSRIGKTLRGSTTVWTV